ncbi:MAG: VCBS repeat-containing protein, partial [Halieaceae bacterium]|nr:VCBS repeat-containing protein [Halieaceae bacterium]
MLMRNTTLLILLSFLAGCKLQIIVPVGGTVTTASGTYTCSAGQICEIDVVDLLFDETFTAVPDAGYLFAQWNKKSGGRGFCATDSSRHNPCRLYTSFFAGWPNLFAFLAMDEVFYLEPVFEAAAECEADTLTAQYRVSSCEFGGAGSKLVLMDFDLDGDLDVIRWGIVPDDQWTGTYPYYEGDPPNPLTAWRNNGNNRFFEATTTVFGEEPIQIIRATLARVIDMDGDGLKDLFIGDGGPDGLPETSPYYDPEHSVHGSYSWLFMQKRSGTLSDESDARLPRILGFTHGMTIGDIEGDGDQDIFLANIWSEQAGTECREAEVLPTADAPCPGFFINDGKGYFSSDLTRIPEEVTRVTHDERGELRWQDGLLIDVDNDGLVELIGNKQLADYLLLNDGAGFFLEENEGAIPERLAGGEQSFDPNNYPLPISTTLTLE